jgi:glycosyltransferase involved in cell wall biosynthesis
LGEKRGEDIEVYAKLIMNSENQNNKFSAGNRGLVLLVADKTCAFNEPCRRALIKLGFEVADFNYRGGIYFHSKILRAISRSFPFIKKAVNKDTNSRFKKIIDFLRPRIVFCIKAETIRPETIQYAKSRGSITLNWYAEIVSFWGNIRAIAPAYDFFFSSDHYILRKLKDEEGLNNCFYLPFAADIDESSPDPFENRSDAYNISMIATYSSFMHANRENYLMSVRDLGLNIWGPKEWLSSSLGNFYRGRAKHVADIYRRTKIVPNIHYNKEPAETTNLRPFEAMSSGAMLISDDVRQDMFRLFKEGEEFVSFHEGDNKKFRELCEYYLNHPEEREAMAKRAYASILAKHTYEIRMREMLNIIFLK